MDENGNSVIVLDAKAMVRMRMRVRAALEASERTAARMKLQYFCDKKFAALSQRQEQEVLAALF